MNKKNKCKYCKGTGIQTKNDGIKIKCPVCFGTGVKTQKVLSRFPLKISDMCKRVSHFLK